jgi:GNAT superfamily N-acetyltransferase
MAPNLTSFQIRPASSDDAPSLSALFGELGFPSSPGEIRQRLESIGSPVLVAVRDGAVVGTATTNVMRVVHRPRPVGRLSALIVAERQRGNGIGRALVRAVEELLKAEGCGLIEITSNLKREDAHAFYKRLGYETTSYRFKKSLVEGEAKP